MGKLANYLVIRSLLAIPTILVLVTLVFILMRLTGDPIAAMVGMKAPPEVIAELRHKAGLDLPIHEQYIRYITGVFTGDLGKTLLYDRPVIKDILDHFPATLELTIYSFIISVLIGVFTGTVAAINQGKFEDVLMRFYGIFTYAIFIPWFGLLLQMVFGNWLGIIPIGGRLSAYISPPPFITGLYTIDSLLTGRLDAFFDALRHLIGPSFTLGIVLSGSYTRIVRANLVDILSQDFITAARARGLRDSLVIKHALKNALIPVITLMGLEFAILLTGAVLTETTFSWNGLGSYLVDMIRNSDYIAVQGTVVFFAIFVSIISVIVDALYAIIDPRIRY
ncbi:ABC transporter permease [Candidatus Geothermarchaeota archaeon]|nr:MAG: ABC transporter permease [Candidatus Geothermarchaeota archaeon]